MREAIRRKLTQAVVLLLLVATILPMGSVFAVSSRYDQSGAFASVGSPLLNSNFSTDAWNKWEIVAWGVFLSNFVVPMADTYESAFSASSTHGSRGSGYKALNFSQAADPESSGILQNFLQFAVDQAMIGELKPLFVSYNYIDVAGNILVNNNGTTEVIDSNKNPTTNANYQPDKTSGATFRDILLVNRNDAANGLDGIVTDAVNNDNGGWLHGVDYTSDDQDDVFGLNTADIGPGANTSSMLTMALPPTAINDRNNHTAKSFTNNSTASVNDIAFGKFPTLWVERADTNGYVKVWDMLDPWDFQIAITMMAKEINSDSEIDSGLGREAIWKTVSANLDKAFESNSQLYLDCFGNIVTLLDGNPYVVIPSAYNKHITSEPMVNLVNSLFLTGATSGVSGKELIRNGKESVRMKYFWWLFNTNEKGENDYSVYGAGLPALGWMGNVIPNNAVALYYDTDSLLGSVFQHIQQDGGGSTPWESPMKYGGFDFSPILIPNYGVLDLDLYGNRKFEWDTNSEFVVPKIELVGMSAAGGLGKAQQLIPAGTASGTTSLLSTLAYTSSIVNLLPASFDEAATDYVQTITWRNDKTPVLGDPVVVPVAFKAGVNDAGRERWEFLARDFINYYGTLYYSTYRLQELARVSEQTGGRAWYNLLTKILMYDDNSHDPVDWWNPSTLLNPASERPSTAVISHAASPTARPYMNIIGMSEPAMTGFIWTVNKFLKNSESMLSQESGLNDSINYPHLTQRWIKAYPTHQILTEVASYLGMRGDTEFAAAAAPWVYLSYLELYGVGNVNKMTLNENPTKFNEQIFSTTGNPLLDYDITALANVKSDEEKAREVNDFTWKLLSPTEGNEYKREILSSIVGNFIYDQYNRTVFGGALEYRSGGVQQVVTRSQTGFLRFPSLEDNLFTRWFYEEYATVALWLLALGLVFIIVFGILRKRKATWFFIAVVLLVSSVVVIPFTNDLASQGMDSLVSNIMDDKTTIWSLTEMLANSRAEEDMLSAGLKSNEAEAAARIIRDLSIVYTDRSLMLRQDISRKIVSLGNFSEYQSFASTRWMLPSIMRQFSADDSSLGYLYVPLLDIADDAANAYWWYNPKDATLSGGITGSDLEANYAVGTSDGKGVALYQPTDIKSFYPNYHSADRNDHLKMSYRSVAQAVDGRVPIHDYVYMYMNNAYSGSGTTMTPKALLPASLSAGRPELKSDNATNALFWGDPEKLEPEDGFIGGKNTFLAEIVGTAGWPSSLAIDVLNRFAPDSSAPSDPYDTTPKKMNWSDAHEELVLRMQAYVRDQRNTMSGEFGYIWSTETLYPYFYALVKETMAAMGQYDYESGLVKNLNATCTDPTHTVPCTNISCMMPDNLWYTSGKQRLGVMINSLTGRIHTDKANFYGEKRANMLFQTGLTMEDLEDLHIDKPTGLGLSDSIFTGYGRDVLDLESLFHNMIPYMYQMTVVTGGLTGDHENDIGIFGAYGEHKGSGVYDYLTKSQYQTYAGLPQSWLYRSNWVVKIVEAPAYNKEEVIGWVDSIGKKHQGTVTMSYFPDAYKVVECTIESHSGCQAGREMVFSEAQLKMSGLSENDLTTLELKLIRLNKDVSTKWTALLNYVNTPGLTAEVLCRQMALDAVVEFGQALTPSGLGNTAFQIYPSSVDLRSLSFDTLMRVILLNATKNSNYFNTDAMEATILEYSVFTGVLLLVTSWVCVYGVTLVRAFFLAFLFLAGVFGVARSVFAANDSKKATLFGYLANIVILFCMSLVYYFIFNVLMTGANDAAYVSTGFSGASVAPGWGMLTILVSSILYIFGMLKMFKIAVKSVISGTGDLGYGVYKDKAQAGIQRLSNGIKEMRAGHSFEAMSNSSVDGGGSVAGASIVRQSGTSTSNKRNRSQNLTSGSGSGSRALQGNNNNQRGSRATALDDYQTIDAITARGGQSTPQQPAMDLENYLTASSGSGTTKTSGSTNSPK